MGSNTFGTLFRMTTWGESHGKAIGVVLDGCPAGLPLSERDIQCKLDQRKPGRNQYTTPRAEGDVAEILSGIFDGKTTGAPISVIIYNKDVDSSKYESIKDIYRPGHANFTYLKKYGIFDYRGGGRASARETACRVIAGAVAEKYLTRIGVHIVAYIVQIGKTQSTAIPQDAAILQKQTETSPIFCPDKHAEHAMMEELKLVHKEGDSLGGIIECQCLGLPIGLGDPIYEKIEAKLSAAMMSLPATKGFEIGSGFASARMRGSEHNDQFTLDESGAVSTETNYAGGLLGGITSGTPLIFRVAFKPTSSIMKPQTSIALDKTSAAFRLPEGSRHDPCVTIRAVPIVNAMAATALFDAYLMQRSAQL